MRIDHKKASMLFLAGILVSAFFSAPVMAGEAEFFVTNVSIKEFSPGETALLNLTLKNLGTEFASRITAQLDPGDTSPIDPLGPVQIQIQKASEATPTSFFGTVRQMEDIDLSFLVGAKPTASEGFYTLPLVLNWDVSGVGKSSTLNIGFTIKNKIAKFTIVSVTPGIINPGGSAEIEMLLRNTGNGFAGNLTADLDSGDVSPIDPIGPTKTYIGRFLHPGDEVKLTYPVNVPTGTSEDVYYTPLVLGWEGYVDGSASFQIGTMVKGDIILGLGSVATDPAEIRSGDDNIKVTVSIENSGDALAQNIIAALKLEEPFRPSYSQSDAAFLGKLSTSESQSATFFLDVDENAEPGKYSIPLDISYEDSDGNSYSVVKSIELLVEPKPYFRISMLKLEPQDLMAGGHGLLYVEIENIGHEAAESVDLRVVRESGQPFDYDTRSDFVGLLKPGERGTALLEFDVEDGAPAKEHLLKLLVRATGDSELGDDNVYTQELKAPIIVQEGSAPEEGTDDRPLVIGVGAVALIVGLIGGRKMRS